MPKILSADEILKVQDVKVEAVEVPEWGGTVYVRHFSARQREEFDSAFSDEDGNKRPATNIRARVVALSACDEAGKLLFTPEQVELLGEKSDAAIDRVFDRAAGLNKLRLKDREAEKKESGTPPPGASPTA